jgi:hypothetical protein
MNRETAPSRHAQDHAPSRVGYLLLRSLPFIALALGIALVVLTPGGDSSRAQFAITLVGISLFASQIVLFVPSSAERDRRRRRPTTARPERQPLPNRIPAMRACYQVLISFVAMLALILPALGSASEARFTAAALNFFAFFLLASGILAVKSWLQTTADARWVDERRAERLSRRPTQTRKHASPRSAPAAEPLKTRRNKPTTSSRLRRRPPGRARVHSFVEWSLLAFVVLGFPVMIALLGPANGMFSYVAIGFILLAVTNRLDTWSAAPIWTPGNAAAAERKRLGKGVGARWLAARPPRLLRHMRTVYLALVVAGFFGCLVWPFLRGWPPERKYPFAATYVVGFLIGLILLSRAEQRQRAREREWLEQRRLERSGG